MMAATSFLQASAHDDMYGPDLDSFGEQWSSFNYAGDANLLTPASNLGSPLMAQKPTAKNMRAFQGQGPTPPSTCRIFYTYDSQASSPMSLPVTDAVPNFDMGTPFVSPYTSRHGSPSGDCDIPGQFDAYLGSFGHLETVECPFPQLTQVSIDPATGLVVGPGGAFKATSGQLLNQGPAVGSIEDLRDPNVILGLPINGFAPHMSPSRRPTHKRRATSPRKLPRTLPRTPKTEDATVVQSIEDDCEKDELTLRDDAPEDDKFLFQLRKQFISEKGKGMWEEMKAKYTERNKGTWEKAALQMKVSRAVAKYGVWPKRELERLEESFRYVEERIYQMMLARMKELGGCKCWDWKPQHIEAQLVKMGLVEAAVDEKSGTRRRKQKIARRRVLTTPSAHQAQMAAAVAAQQHHQQQQAAVMAHHHVMNDWAGGLGLHPGLAVPMSRHPSYESHHMSGPMMAMASSSPDDDDGQPPMPPPTFTSAEEDGILDQIFPPNKDLEDSMSPEAVGLVFDDGNSSVNGVLDVEREVNGPGSQRVARQVCEQMMQASMQGQQRFALAR